MVRENPRRQWFANFGDGSVVGRRVEPGNVEKHFVHVDGNRDDRDFVAGFDHSGKAELQQRSVGHGVFEMKMTVEDDGRGATCGEFDAYE